MTQLNPFQMLRLEHLAPSPTNPRKRISTAEIADLAEKIAPVGVMQPPSSRRAACGALQRGWSCINTGWGR